MIGKLKKFLWNKTALWCGLAIIFYYLVDTGYCFPEWKYLSDEDFIQAAVRSNVRDMDIDGSEESIKNFHAKHPKCCSVSRSYVSWGERLWFGNYVTVELNYKMKSKIPTERKYMFYRQYLRMLQCGDAGSNYGETTKSLESVSN